MPYQIELKSAEIAALVNSDESLKSAVISLYLKDNQPTLTITDLQDKTQGEQIVVDTVKLSASTLNVGIGAKGQIDVTTTGNSEIAVKSGDERIATVVYAEGKLAVHGIAAGDTTIVVTRGDQKAELKVVVR